MKEINHMTNIVYHTQSGIVNIMSCLLRNIEDAYFMGVKE